MIVKEAVVFTDIDGVVNSYAFSHAGNRSSIDVACVLRLNRILTETDAKLVLSSSWRYMIFGGAMTVLGFDYLLRTHGFLADRLIGCTPMEEPHASRGREIQAWREKNGHSGPYVVLDDCDLDISKLHPFVHTDASIGLTDQDADRAISILKG